MKKKRLDLIKELITTYDIETQEELVERLHAAGFEVTQATVSRDLRELKLTKVPGEKGGSKYALVADDAHHNRYGGVLSTGLISAASAEKLVVVKTVSGMAMAVAAAIDHMHPEGVVGCIAGDDTIFIALSEDCDTEAVIASLTGGTEA